MYYGETAIKLGIHKCLQVSLTFGALGVPWILPPKVSHLSFPSLLSSYINYTRGSLDLRGSNTFTANEVHKPKPKPANASRLLNRKVRTTNHKQPSRRFQIKQPYEL